MQIENTYAPLIYDAETGKIRCMLYVLICPVPGLYKAYAGVVDVATAEDDDLRAVAAQRVVSKGTRLNLSQAKTAFPMMRESIYAL